MTDRKPRAVTEPARTIPVLLDADVVVVGGGTTGPVAAVAAARRGKRVVLVERFGSLGGNLTLGLNTKPSGPLVVGVPRELWERARSLGGVGEDYVAATKTGTMSIASPGDPEVMKMLLARTCAEAGVQVLFETFVSRPVVEDATVTGLVVEGKFGRQCITTRVVIDCSADGDVAAGCGAPFVTGSGGKAPSMQPVSMYFTMDRVDIRRLAAWARESDDIPARAIPERDEDLDFGLWLTGFNRSIRRFNEETGADLQRENITLKTTNGVLYVNATRVLGVDVFSPVAFSSAVLECYRQVEAVTRFLRERVPGFEAAKILQVSPVLGVRETRHVQGEYVLTGEDTLSGRHFEDSIAADASALDVHEPKGADVDFRGLRPYEIPYRCLVPLGVEQLLVAGRCIAADHEAHARTRNMPACMATGQAAGVAAAVALEAGTSVRRAPIERIQSALRELKMPLHGNEIN
jgi:glycine/D-amino acid oxidase-like deaminating enzyme